VPRVRGVRGVREVREVRISGVLLDVGGVLVELDGVPSLARLLRIEPLHDEIHRLWMASPSVVLHETGKISAHEFAQGVVDDLGLPISPEAFLMEFAGWLGQPYPGAFDLVEAIPEQYQVAILSNMSALHWNRIAEMGFPRRIDRRFVSYEIGQLKPSDGAFDHALKEMGLPADEVLFLDDGVSNVNAATTLGIRAQIVRNLREVQCVLEEYGVL
jgi:HAD superfamily hydrolase (TIGR01509 family)